MLFSFLITLASASPPRTIGSPASTQAPRDFQGGDYSRLNRLTQIYKGTGQMSFDGEQQIIWVYHVVEQGPDLEWVEQGLRDSADLLLRWSLKRGLSFDVHDNVNQLDLYFVPNAVLNDIARFGDIVSPGRQLLGLYTRISYDSSIITVGNFERSSQRKTLAHELAHFAYDHYGWSAQETLDTEAFAQLFAKHALKIWDSNPLSPTARPAPAPAPQAPDPMNIRIKPKENIVLHIDPPPNIVLHIDPPPTIVLDIDALPKWTQPCKTQRQRHTKMRRGLPCE